MEKFTFYAHGSKSDPYSKYQCPINIAATLCGQAMKLDEALYYMHRYMPTQLTQENYSPTQLKQDFNTRLVPVLDKILECKSKLPSKLVEEVEYLKLHMFEILFELLTYDVMGIHLDAWVEIPEYGERNQLKTFLDNMRVPKLSNIRNKFKRYLRPLMCSYMFDDCEMEFVSDDTSIKYYIKSNDLLSSDKSFKVILKFD